jgi:hypothetical protein
MRIIIETQNEGRILLESEKLGAMEGVQQEPQETAIDAGSPSDELMNAIAGATSSPPSEELESEQGAEFVSLEESPEYH